MEKQERLLDIVKYIDRVQRASTIEIAKKFKVTEQTVRNDLKVLDKQGKIVRIHGGAKSTILPDSFEDRLVNNKEEKIKIGKYAAKRVNKDDILFLDGGTSHLYLVDFLPSNIALTVITANLPIAVKCSKKENIHLFLLGGDFDKQTQQFFGPRTIADIEQMNINKAFVGVSSYDFEQGFYEDNTLTLPVKQCVIKQAQKVIVMADSQKHNKKGLQKAFDTDDVDLLITGDLNKDISIRSLPYIIHTIK